MWNKGMMEFLHLANDYGTLLWMLATVLAGFVLWHMSQRFVSKEAFELAMAAQDKARAKQEESLAVLRDSILELNATIKNMPSIGSLHRLELGLEELRGLQRETAAQLKGHLAAMERLNNSVDRLTIQTQEKR